MTLRAYRTVFFDEIRQGSLSSAAAVVPLLMEWVHPKSVLDVGCGEGAWLAHFAQHGVVDICGLDGLHIDRSRLLIDEEQFVPWDLTSQFSLGRCFDLAICLEVAEHLPETCADGLIKSIAIHAGVVIFSASIPFQGGTGHVNEQWPEYWVRKFRSLDYVPVDCIRPRIWDDKRVCWWFSQNTLLFIRRVELEQYEFAKAWVERQVGDPLALVHPGLWLHQQEVIREMQGNGDSPRWLLKRLARSVLSRDH